MSWFRKMRRIFISVLLGHWHKLGLELKISVKLVRQMILSWTLTCKVVDQQWQICLSKRTTVSKTLSERLLFRELFSQRRDCLSNDSKQISSECHLHQNCSIFSLNGRQHQPKSSWSLSIIACLLGKRIWQKCYPILSKLFWTFINTMFTCMELLMSFLAKNDWGRI